MNHPRDDWYPSLHLFGSLLPGPSSTVAYQPDPGSDSGPGLP